MATSKEKFELVFDAREQASQKIKTLERRLAELGGPQMVKSQKTIKKLERNIKMLGGEAKKGRKGFSRFITGIAKGNIIANAATAAWHAVTNAIKGTFEAAANTQKQWRMVTSALERHQLATNNNITAIRTFADEMQSLTGVADEEYGRAVQMMVDRGTSLSQAFQLVGATADIAASKNKQMSRVLQEIADVIGRKDLLTLEKYGVVVDRSASFTEQLDTAIQQLNKNFGGAASDAASEFGTRMGVLEQKFGDLQEKIGAQLLPILLEFGELLIAVIDDISEVVFGKQFNEQGEQVVDAGEKIAGAIRNIRAHSAAWVKTMVSGGNVIINAMQAVVGAVRTVASPIIDLFGSMAFAVQGKFADAKIMLEGIWTNIQFEATKTSVQIDEMMESFVSFMEGLEETSGQATNAIVDNAKTTEQVTNEAIERISQTAIAANEATATTANTATTALGMMAQSVATAQGYMNVLTNPATQASLSIASMMTNMSGFITTTVKNSAQGVTNMSRSAIQFSATAGQRMRSNIGNAVNSMIDNMVTGRQSFADIFKGIAQDFMIFFIQEALNMVVSMLIPGLGSLLGSIFDTPANDKMAARQGRDFMKWFTRGALAEAQGGSELAVGISGASNTITPIAAPSSGGGNGSMVMMNVQISGNVMSDQFISKIVAPKLQRLINDGRTLIEMKQENKTGKRDWRV